VRFYIVAGFLRVSIIALLPFLFFLQVSINPENGVIDPFGMVSTRRWYFHAPLLSTRSFPLVGQTSPQFVSRLLFYICWWCLFILAPTSYSLSSSIMSAETRDNKGDPIHDL